MFLTTNFSDTLRLDFLVVLEITWVLILKGNNWDLQTFLTEVLAMLQGGS